MNDEQLIWEAYEKILESFSNIDVVYHGGDWNGVSVPFIRRGSYGIGTYFSPDKNESLERAKEYNGKYIVKCKFKNNKFVEVHHEQYYPHLSARIQTFINMGYPNDEKSIEKLNNKINNIQEKYGYMGSEFRKYSEKHNLGYQGIATFYNNKLLEVCSWYPYNIQVLEVENVVKE